jgi:hypothetical protein
MWLSSPRSGRVYRRPSRVPRVNRLQSHPSLEGLEDRLTPASEGIGIDPIATYNSNHIGNPDWAISYDSAGDTYVASYFSGTKSFGSVSLTAPGTGAAFVTKIDPSGNFLWAKVLGSDPNWFGIGLTVDTSSNVYVTGEFQGTASFGSTSLTGAGSNDVFLSKLDTNGTFLWSIRWGGTGSDESHTVALDGSGNIYVSGAFLNAVSFGSTTLTTPPNTSEAFLTKLDPNGNFLWAVQPTGNWGVGLAVDSAGISYVGGDLGDADNGGSVCSYDTSGNLRWTDTGLSIPLSLGSYTDSNGNDYVYTIGTFGQFGAVKLSGSTGNVVWSRSAPTPPGFNEGIYALAADANGNVYMTTPEHFASPLGVDSGPGTASLEAPHCVAKWDANGNFVSVRIVGGWVIAVDSSGNIYSVGYGPGSYDLGSQDIQYGTDTAFVVAVTTQDEGGIIGQVFDDLNNNGILDANENGVTPVTVYADLNNNGQFDTGEPSITVVNNAQVAGQYPRVFGEYYLNHLTPGTYTIREVLPPGWAQTSPSGNNGITVTVPAGQYIDTANFGAFYPNHTATYSNTRALSIPAAPKKNSKTVTSTIAVSESSTMLALQLSTNVTGAAGASFTLITPSGTSLSVTPNTTISFPAACFGVNDHGTWTLSITTSNGGPGGTLNSWSFTITSENAGHTISPLIGYTEALQALPQQRSELAPVGSAPIQSVTDVSNQDDKVTGGIGALSSLQADQSARALVLATDRKGMRQSDIDRLFSAHWEKLLSKLV